MDVPVEYNGVRSDAVTAPVLTSRPGVFSVDGSGQGQGTILNENGSPNSPTNPAARGSIITLYATGGDESAPGTQVNVRVPVNAVITGDAVPFALIIGSHWTMLQVTIALR